VQAAGRVGQSRKTGRKGSRQGWLKQAGRAMKTRQAGTQDSAE
jgi:hypothetical protein